MRPAPARASFSPRGVSSHCSPARVELEVERQQGDQDRAGDHARIAVDVAAQDQVPERAQARQRGQGGRGDDVDRRGPHPGHDRGHRERQLDAGDDLQAAHAHAAGGLHGVAVDLAHPDVGVGEDRRDPQDGEREGDVEQPDADEGGDEGDQRQLRDGPARVPDRDRDALAPAEVAEGHADRQRDQRATAPERRKVTLRCWPVRCST